MITRTGLVLACALCAAAQQTGDKPSSASTGKPESQAADPQTHADAVKLVTVNGMGERLATNLNGMMDAGKTRMLSTFPTCNAAFGDEWVRRMQVQLKPDIFVQIAVSALETHIGDADLKKLIEFQEGAKANPQNPPVLDPEFKQKISGPMSAVQHEILNGCIKAASKMSYEAGEQIKKEHPDYCTAAPPEKPKGE